MGIIRSTGENKINLKLYAILGNKWKTIEIHDIKNISYES